MCTCVTRRGFLAAAAAGATVGLGGCDELGLVSDEEVTRMGLEAWSQMTGRVPVSGDATLRNVTAEVSDRLLRAAGERPSDWEIRVFASPEVNAFALPGGKIGVYEGIFRAARTPSQLAAIVGHEIGHLRADHAKKRITAQVAKDAGVRLVAWALRAGEIEFADEIAGALGLGIDLGLVLPYSRDQEIEADQLGLHVMNDAGFDPAEAIPLWQRMQQLSGARGPAFLATHPEPQARIEHIRALLPQLGG